MSNPLPLEAIFFAALEKESPAERAEYLDEACAENPELRRRVERMLIAQAKAGSFLEMPAAESAGTGAFAAAAKQTATESPGTVLGPYKLIEQIGEGGMGTVWMAQQTEPIKRLVAVKLIKAGMESKLVIARFEAERQALALMDHPNIASVLDAGTTSASRPYFVMDLVKGVPITKYCDEHHLTPRERLKLFVPVCQAIQHAHQKGIIHRDIKPSNVLVAQYDGKPVPKVIDFGVAKAAGQALTDKTLITGFGMIVGSMEYMSPEQAEVNQLDIDTRSDIYSLGVLLYELLAGSPPFSQKELQKAGMLEMLRVIREREPSKPSTKLSSSDALPTLSANRSTEPAKLARLVRGELDWIVMKALEKDRNRRYETANGFALDIERYLSDEAVLACPPSVGYRLRKFARRNKAALAVTGLVLLILLAVTGGVGWNVRDRAARQTAVEQEVRLALKEAEQWQEQAKWPEALSAAKRAEGLLTGGGSEELRERTRQLRKDLEMVLRLEEIPLLSSGLKDNKFDWEAAARGYAQAFADYGIDVAGVPEEASMRMSAQAEVAVALATALDDWAYAISKADPAVSTRLTALAQAIDTDTWRRQMREAVKQKDPKGVAALASAPEIVRQPPTSLLLLARTLQAGGLVDAEISVLRQAQRQYPGDFWINFSLASALNSKGLPDRDEFISFARATLAVRPQSSSAHNSLGIALKQRGKVDEAIAYYHKAIELGPKSAIAYCNLGLALQAQGKMDEAIDCYHKAIELDPKFFTAHASLGHALETRGKLDDAIVCYRRSIELDPKDAWTHNALGTTLAMKGWDLANHPDPKRRDPKRAVELVTEAVELAPQSVAALQYLGWVQYRSGNWEASIEALEKSCQLQEGGAGDSYQWIVLALAHAQLAAQEGLSAKERVRHRAESRRRYEPSAKALDGKNWTTRPSDVLDQAVWDFRQEALKLIGSKE